MWTGTSAAVRSPIAGSAVAAVMHQVAGSTSQKTGVAPIAATASAVAKKVNAGTTTSSPGPTPRARRPIISASVPLRDPDAVVHAGVVGEFGLQGLDLRPEDVAAALEHRPLALGDLWEERFERGATGEQRQGQGPLRVSP